MRVIGYVFVILAAFLAVAPVWANEGKLVHVVRFTDYRLGSVEDWLQGKGFQFKEDVRRRDHIDLDVKKKALSSKLSAALSGFC